MNKRPNRSDLHETVARSIDKPLRKWFRGHSRDLPWRKTNDPYAIWISEIMLQQTQVATVIAYFHRFLAKFPDVASLAAAEEADVLKLWEGLGYYRRARQLHAAAKKIVSEHEGCFPNDFDDVLALPGIGRYTAGAICSFAYDRPHPIVEANTQRLYSRLMLLREDPRTTASQKKLWEFAERILPKKSPAEFNQALMELGSLVCTPTQPKCLLCPLQEICPTYAAGSQESIPVSATKKTFENRTEIALIVWKNDQILLRQNLPGERWTGLWDFPRYLVPDFDHWHEIFDSIYQQLWDDLGVKATLQHPRLKIKHGVTRYRITLHALDAGFQSGPKTNTAPWQWKSIEELVDVPLNSTGRKIAKDILLRPHIAGLSQQQQ